MIGSIRRRSAWTSFILNIKYSMCALYLPVNKIVSELFGIQKRRQGYTCGMYTCGMRRLWPLSYPLVGYCQYMCMLTLYMSKSLYVVYDVFVFG